MKVVQINLTARQGGTGRVCYGIAQALNANEIENYTLYVSGKPQLKNEINYSKGNERRLEALKSRLLGNYGFNSRAMTKRLISHLEEIKPDIIHLHNLHAHNVNLKMLFEYFKKNPQIKLYWTFHDLWAFTGYCPYFEMVGCEKWKSGCGNCPQRKQFSWLFDKSRSLYNKKRELFSGLNLKIIAPSNYIANMARESFFKEYDIKVINNGVDLDVFKPTESDFREKHSLKDKYIVLGVAINWEMRKGLNTFIELSKELPEGYQIVLVGTNNEIDKSLPSNIISIHKTESIKELKEIYTASDVLLNPTLEEAFGMVNIESLACGTPVITYNSGGSPECINKSCGIVVEKYDLKAVKEAVIHICEDKPFTSEACIEGAKAFDKNITFEKYIGIYTNESNFTNDQGDLNE